MDLTATAAGKGAVQNALVVHVVGDSAISGIAKEEPWRATRLHVLCLTADNQIYQTDIRHVVGVAEESYELPEGWDSVKEAIQQQQSVKCWDRLNGMLVPG